LAARQQKVETKLADRYEITQDRIKRELALLGFSNMLDYGRVDDDGEFHIDLSATDRDQAAAIQGVKSRRTRRTIGEIEIEEHTTELKLAPKREALVDLGKAVGLFRDGVDITVPVRFIVERTERSANRRPAEDDEAAPA
jgi:phage terminase small subunit